MTNTITRSAARAGLAFVLGVAALTAVPASAATPLTVGAAQLAGRTEIQWTGNAGLTLRVPRLAALPEDPPHSRVFLTGGTYAFARFVRRGGCPGDLPAHCQISALTYTRHLANSEFFGPQWRASRGAGTDHDADFATTPAEFDRGDYDVYLFTDGHARLVLLPEGYSGTISVTAGRRVDGTVVKLPSWCHTNAPCTPSTGYGDNRLRTGGASYRLTSLGVAEVLGYNADASPPAQVAPGVPYAQPHGFRPCLYPGLYKGTSSPKVGDHPYGCDYTGADADAQSWAAQDTYGSVAWAATSTGGLYRRDWNSEAKGDSYAGFQMITPANYYQPSYQDAYGLWFRYAWK